MTTYFISILLGVIIQEAFRGGLFRVYQHTEAYVNKMQLGSMASNSATLAPMPLNDLTSAIAAGVGFGTMHSVVLFGGALAASTGPGAMYLDTCPHYPLIMLAALQALLFEALDLSLTCLMFQAVRSSNPGGVLVVILLHLSASFVSSINTIPMGCW
eukprot:CAMPEP_0113944096 /NCGR_PEP_ID=MMETSP1339-20121228/30636_1 /TAXON_ID=94617 /ORGANISM="Fibrocapsa japonica" /LENGTH=156 /DNA_ID=CAMNT_0000949167 /DNA_START=195 /DNA_END=662 /DNA_ORIENTATION=+ /assembly_acc=CAM_ASM_000762